MCLRQTLGRLRDAGSRYKSAFVPPCALPVAWMLIVPPLVIKFDASPVAVTLAS